MDLDSDLDFILFEIKYNNEVKWVEKDGIAVGYEDVINLGKCYKNSLKKCMEKLKKK